MIVGTAGAGKSTFAKRLGAALAIPVIHLDQLRWEPGWRMVDDDAFRQRVRDAITDDQWITDGNYAALTFDLRLPRADLFILLDPPTLGCCWRVLRRMLGNHLDEKESLADGCRERLDRRFFDRVRYIAGFRRINLPRIEGYRAALGPEVSVLVLHNKREIAAALESITESLR